MKTVNIGQLKDHLSTYLQHVKNGEEVIVRDRNVPVARILPFRQEPGWDNEAELVASGAMKMPEQDGPMDWDDFFRTPVGNVSKEVAIRALIDSRGDM